MTFLCSIRYQIKFNLFLLGLALLTVLFSCNHMAYADGEIAKTVPAANVVNPLVSPVCPFKEGATSFKQLSDLANTLFKEVAKCDKTYTVNNLAQIINSDIPTITTNINTADCYNYQTVYENALQSSLIEPSDKRNEFVSACIGESAQVVIVNNSQQQEVMRTASAECLNKQYQKNLMIKINLCENSANLQKQNTINAAYRNLITETTAIARKAIDTPECANAMSDIIGLSMSTLTAMASASPVLGIAGAGLAAVGDLLGSIINRSDVAKELKKIERTTFSDDVSCLFFYSFKEANQCFDRVLQPVSNPTVICEKNETNDLKNKLSSIASVVNLINATQNKENKMKDLLDLVEPFFNDKIKELCENGATCEVSKLNIQKDPTYKISKYDIVESIKRVDKLLKTKNKDTFQTEPKDLSHIHVVMQAILMKDKANPSAYDDLLSLEYTQAMMSTDLIINTISKNSEINKTSGVNEIYDSVMKIFSSNVKERLDNLTTKFHQNNKIYNNLQMNNIKLSDVNGKKKFSDIGKILQVCTLNAGAFYQKTNGDSSASLSFVDDNSSFKRICSPLLECLNEHVPSKSLDYNENQKQLCDLAKNYNSMLIKLENLKVSDITSDGSSRIKCQKSK